MTRRAIIDLSSVIWTCLKAGVDKEFGSPSLDAEGKPMFTGTGKPIITNSAGYGYDNVIAHLTEVMKDIRVVPRQMILVKEGLNSKLGRQALHPGYKAGRDKTAGDYDQFNLCRDQVIKTFRDLGAQVCWQDGGVEADDVLGYLAQYLKGEVWIVSGDKDLAQCVDGRDVHHYRSGLKDENPFGPFSHHLIPIYIALVGDSADKIPGAKGFGAGAAEKLLLTFGEEGLEMMGGLIKSKDLQALVRDGDVKELKELQKVVDDETGVYLSYELGRLRLEKVNTLKKPLQWQAGMVMPRSECSEESLKKYAGLNKLVCAENYDESVEFFKRQIAKTPEFTLDLETYVPEESVEWLERRTKKGGGVDVIGSIIASCGLTFGENAQFNFYLTTDHKEEEGVTNLTLVQVREFLEMIPQSKLTVAHNAAGFELPVMYNAFAKIWKDNGWRGMFPNMVDSRVAATYWDEDQFSHGLKGLSKLLLGYEQTSYEDTTTTEEVKSEWNGEGVVLKEWVAQIETPTGIFEQVPVFDAEGIPLMDGDDNQLTEQGDEIISYSDGPEMVRVERNMHELTARHVLGYGLDDVATTSALWNFFVIIMEIDNSYKAFMELEQKPMYLSALSFVQGTPVSLEHLNNMSKADDAKFEEAKTELDTYLVGLGWDGTVCPVYEEFTPVGIKEAYNILTGDTLTTMVRTPAKLAKLIRMRIQEPEFLALDDDEGTAQNRAIILATMIEDENIEVVNKMVAQRFNGAPTFDTASPKQVGKLLYETLGLPVRLRNRATDIMRAKGIKEGTAKTDDAAIELAQRVGDVVKGSAEYGILTALMAMKGINTARGLYYEPYPKLVHWATRKLHPGLIQCGTNTRRWTSNSPNIQQLNKEDGGVRSAILPHHRGAVIVSLDESAQEVRQLADYCMDPSLLTCFMGLASELRDIHSLVGCRILKTTYRDLKLEAKDPQSEFYSVAAKVRDAAKTTLFGLVYGAMAPKIAEGLGISVEEAQSYIDAIFAQFPGIQKWKAATEAFVEKHGWVAVHGGTVRHLRKQLLSDNSYERSKALRQASNARIQGAGASQLKRIMTDIWNSRLIEDFDYRWYFPVHDETVHSIGRGDVVAAVKILHWMMTKQFLHTVPSASSIGFGRNFGELIEIGETFDVSKIEGALAKCFNDPVLLAA